MGTKKLAVLNTLVAGSLLSPVYGEYSRNIVPSSHKEVDCGLGAKPMRMTVRHIDPKGIGYNQGYTTAEGFFSLYNGWDRWTLFLDTRAHVFNNGQPALNAGIGTRYRSDSRIWGINSYYDYRKTNRYHYNQVTVGLEFLGEIWDFRLNGYAPVGRWTSAYYHSAFAYFKGNYAILRQKYEYALGGFNGEAAIHVNKWDHFPLYFAAGPYYLNGKGGSTWGGQARASIMIYDYLKVEGNVSYDHLFRWIGQGQVGLSFSFGGRKEVKSKTGDCSSALALSRRAYQPVDRFEIIPVDQKYKHSTAINPSTRLPYFFTFVDNTSSSLGTFESPYATLATAQANSGPDGVIYVFPGDGTSKGMNTGIQLQTNQKLWGSVVAQNLPTTIGNITIHAQSSGGIVQGIITTPLITNGSNDTVVSIVSGNEISGFCIQNSGGSSTAIANSATATDLSVLNCTIGGSGSIPYAGIGVSDLGGTLTVDNCTFNEGYGVSIFNTSTNLVANISNSQFSGGADGSIYWLYNGPVQGTLTVQNCMINSDGNAVYLQQVTGSSLTAILNNNTMISNSQGVHMQGAGTSAQTLSMTGNSILAQNQSIYIIQTDTLSATFNKNSLTSVNSSHAAFELDSNAGSTNATLAFANNTLISQYSTSAYFNQSAGHVTASFQNNMIMSYDGGTGVEIMMGSSAASQILTFDSNIFNGGEYAFYISQTVGDLTLTANNNTITSPYGGYGLYSAAGGSSQKLNLNNNSIVGSYYTVYVDQTEGTLQAALNNNNLVSGSDDYTVYFDLAGGTSSQVAMNGNNLTGYYPVYIYQNNSDTAAISFTNNTILAGTYGLYVDVNSGTGNTLTVSGNNLAGSLPLYVQHYGGDLDYTVNNNTLTSTGDYGLQYDVPSGTITSNLTISGNTITSAGANAINLGFGGSGGTFTIAITENTLSASSAYAIVSGISSGVQSLSVSDNIITNSGGLNLGITGGTARWQVDGNHLTAISTTPVNAVASGGTVACMQLNNNAVYPVSSTNAYVLNGTGSTSFTLNPPSGNTGNTHISTTAVTQSACSP